MANSADLAPMDFAINSIFKRILKKRAVNNRKQLARAVRTEWKKFPMRTIRRALLSWRDRVDLMLEARGYQFEHKL